jgi:hypothetical protein
MPVGCNDESVKALKSPSTNVQVKREQPPGVLEAEEPPSGSQPGNYSKKRRAFVGSTPGSLSRRGV